LSWVYGDTRKFARTLWHGGDFFFLLLLNFFFFNIKQYMCIRVAGDNNGRPALSKKHKNGSTSVHPALGMMVAVWIIITQRIFSLWIRTLHVSTATGAKRHYGATVNDTTVAARRENERKLWVKKTLFSLYKCILMLYT